MNKIGRNAPCPCGSGLKYKKCCIDKPRVSPPSQNTFSNISPLQNIDGNNDITQQIKELAQWVFEELGPDVPVHFTAFHPSYKLLDNQRTSLEILQKARMIGLDAGLYYVYTGNVLYAPGDQTLCHDCGTVLIDRNRHQLEKYRLDGL